jgi:hypothetical protein
VTFDFDPALSASETIDRFHKHLESVDPELAAVLKTYLPTIVPAPENSYQRAASRQKFTESVLNDLDQPKPGPTK